MNPLNSRLNVHVKTGTELGRGRNGLRGTLPTLPPHPLPEIFCESKKELNAVFYPVWIDI